ncbi:GNAT family N-acetyltransferase [Jiella avicenniae]|uniref:GNAT family N-acetyltransferase n=1 Tax=Jiella avicenniae TaxID=2907202 RepID=A0A9X1T6K4_9HYPH|nr:GNAT family N-acetyltransferase [Jiella avicenniae]MCE7030312.1 GNAT family N-acetyltransferase [Jiella avicenniae]
MTARVRPAGAADVDPVAAFLHERMNARISAGTWRALLDYPWRPPEVERGWLVEDEGAVVGFMGTIYSDRPTAKGTRRFCDLSSWYLAAAYRGTGIGDELLRAGMAKPGVTYQTMTARRATGRKIRALGFSILDEARSLFRPGEAVEELRPIRDPAEIRERLTGEERRMLDDHHGLDIHHAVVEGRAGQGTWLVWQRKLKGAGVAYHDVLHASDYDFLSAHAAQIAGLVCVGETAVLAIDRRMMNDGDDPGAVETIPLPRWYRSPDVARRDVGHLYSEVLLLDQKLP